jgi:hypothetical protein
MLRKKLQYKTSNPLPAPDLSFLAGKSASFTNRIAHNVLKELYSMREVLGEPALEPDFASLAQSVISPLSHIGHLVMEGRSMPWVRVKHSAGDHPVPPVHREVRLGVFPVAANPLHWAHLLGGLLTIEALALDKVIYVVAGNDFRKLDMAPAEARHAMARSLLRLFHPLFEYSSIALGDSSSGEENLFRILGMNPLQPIHAYYIAGSDHYHRYDPATRDPDTLGKIEEGIARAANGLDSRIHRISVVFLEREHVAEEIPTSLDVLWVRGLPVQTSSSSIRRAFSDREQRKKLCTLPFTAYMSICGDRLYSSKDFCEETSAQKPS